VHLMGKKEIQVRLIDGDILNRLDHALSLEDQKSRDKVEACSSGEWLSGWLQIFSPLLMFDVTKPGRLKRREFGGVINKIRAQRTQMEGRNVGHTLGPEVCPLDLSGRAGMLRAPLGPRHDHGIMDVGDQSGWLGVLNP
jgi:hypothetical protein